MVRLKSLVAMLAGVGLCAEMAMFIGCAGSNPVSSVSEDLTGGFSVRASLVTGSTDTIGVDTGVVNDNCIFRWIDQNGKRDSVESCSYDFGDGTVIPYPDGLQNGIHRYYAAGKYSVKLSVRMLNGTIYACGTVIVVVTSRTTPVMASKDSVYKFISSVPVGAGTNVFSITFGTLVSAVTPTSGTINPFTEGYDDWDTPILMNALPRSANNRLFLVTKTLEGGMFYNVGLGKRWNGTNNNSLWLSPIEQAGNKYYYSAEKVMRIFVGYNGIPYSIDSIPADSGRGTLPPPAAIDTTHPGTYGDAGAYWRVRFKDIDHSKVAGGLDSVIIYHSLHGLEACSTSTAIMTTNIPGKASINLIRPAGKLYAYAIVAAAEVPNSEGLVWNYSWGSCVQADNSASGFWRYAVNGVVTAFQARWMTNSVGLPKSLAGSSGHMASVQ